MEVLDQEPRKDKERVNRGYFLSKLQLDLNICDVTDDVKCYPLSGEIGCYWLNLILNVENLRSRHKKTFDSTTSHHQRDFWRK